MFNFFAKFDLRRNDRYYIEGADYNHIKNVRRMTGGDKFLVSDGQSSHLCEIEAITEQNVVARIIEENRQSTRLAVKIHLFQGLPKADKMELIIQKCVELGADKIFPVEMEHCVVKLDGKKKEAKINRWQAIAESAAKQSKRSDIPEICEVLSFKKALELAKGLDLVLVPFENARGMTATNEVLSEIKSGMSIGIFIGPEGGFSEKEIETARALGFKTVSLGKRILRTETAAITAVGMCMLYSEMNLGDN